jgi:G:T/U-mismatch repair DNA glycosylase
MYPVYGIPAQKLPSTSPANAGYSLERLLEEWGSALNGELQIWD